MKRIIAIGDIHGLDHWEKIIAADTHADKYVFVGDYFDSWDKSLTCDKHIKNFEKILDLKRKAPKKFILLVGNHDYHYMKGVEDRYSGYDESHAVKIQKSLDKALKEGLLQMCYVEQDVLFSHAGVTKTWLASLDVGEKDVENGINAIFKNKIDRFKFTPGENNSPYGDDVTQSCIWVRPESLIKDGLDTFLQVVGHTHQEKGVGMRNNYIFIDTLNSEDKCYLEVNIGGENLTTYVHKL